MPIPRLHKETPLYSKVKTVGAYLKLLADSIVSLVQMDETYTDPSGNTVTNHAASLIKQNADNILLRVEKNGVISSINQSPEAVTINASKVNIAGAALFTTGALSKVVKTQNVQWYSSTSRTALTGGSWSTTQPTLTAGRYLWQREYVAYSNGDTAYLPSSDGVCVTPDTDAVKGVSVEYAQNQSRTMAPTGASDWSTTAPAYQRGWYIWTRTKTVTASGTSYTTPTCISGRDGDDAVSPYEYAINATPTALVRSVGGTLTPNTITFSATRAQGAGTPSAYSGRFVIAEYDGSSWSNKYTSSSNESSKVYAPSSTARIVRCNLYMAGGTSTMVDTQSVGIASDGATGATGPTGASGYNTATVYLYQRKASTPSKPSNTLTYTFATHELSGTINNGWSTTIPSGTDPCYVIAATAASTEATDTIASSEWSAPVMLAQDGSDAYMYDIEMQPAALVRGEDGTLSPSSVTFYANRAKGSNYAAYAGRFAIAEHDGSSWVTKYTSSSNESSKAYSPTSTARIVRCELYLAGGTTTLVDRQSVPIASDGATGDSAYTVMLTNESHTFAAGTSAAVAGLATTNVIALKGSTRQKVTVGTITGAPTGMTVGVSSNNTTSPTVSVSVTTSLTTRSGTLDIPVTVDGNSFTLVFSWSLALTGANGATGATGATGAAGANGLNQATVYLYQRAASSPAKPSSALTYTFSSGALSGTLGSWTRTVPATSGNPCWVTSAVAISASATDSIASSEWATPTKLVEDGANAYTVLLTNEAHTFAATTDAAIASSTTTQVVAYKGTTQMAASIGAVSGAPTGMSTTKSNNNTTTASLTVSVTTSLTTRQGVLTIPVTVDGKVFNLTFSWSLALTGADGADGADGTGISAITEQYYLSTSNTTQTGGSWSTTPQSYVSGRYYWTRVKVTWTNNTTTYTDPVLANGLNGSLALAHGAYNNGAGREQYIWFAAVSGTNSLSANTTWVTETGDVTNQWTAVRPTFNTSYPVIFCARQTQTVAQLGGTACSCTTPYKDTTTTHINGAQIVTGTIDCEKVTLNKLSASWITTGKLNASVIGSGSISANKLDADVRHNIYRDSEYHAVCTSSSDSNAKVAICEGFAQFLKQGVAVTVYNVTSQTCTGTLTLGVKAADNEYYSEYDVYVGGVVTSSTNQLLWAARSTVTFVFDDSGHWEVADNPGSWDGGSCSASASTGAKTATANGCVIFKGASVKVRMSNRNDSSSPTLNVSSLGSKSIYYGDTSNAPTFSNGNTWLGGSIADFVFDGQYWRTGMLTVIDGGNIRTGSITATQIQAHSITANEISSSYVYAGSINASQIQAGTLGANVIYGGTISGDKINGGTISGVTLESQGDNQNVKIEDGLIKFYFNNDSYNSATIEPTNHTYGAIAITNRIGSFYAQFGESAISFRNRQYEIEIDNSGIKFYRITGGGTYSLLDSWS